MGDAACDLAEARAKVTARPKEIRPNMKPGRQRGQTRQRRHAQSLAGSHLKAVLMPSFEVAPQVSRPAPEGKRNPRFAQARGRATGARPAAFLSFMSPPSLRYAEPIEDHLHTPAAA